jgi:hypothetical protein
MPRGRVKYELFPKRDCTKRWTTHKAYQRWVRKLKTSKRPRRSATKDLCSSKSNICKGTLGIQRRHMPQFTKRNAPFSKKPLKNFQSFIKKKYDVKSRIVTRKAKDLKPSQGEISRARVNDLIDDNVLKNVEVPIVVSQNGYVIDGHHRWAAFRTKAPKKKLKAVVVDAPVQDVLGMAIDWGAGTEKF